MPDTLIIKAGATEHLRENTPLLRHIVVEKGARLYHYRTQELPVGTKADVETVIEVRENAFYEGFILQTGACDARIKTLVKLCGEKSAASVNGIYLAAGKQKLLLDTEIRHLASKTVSSQEVRGVATDKAEGEFIGLIDVAFGVSSIEGSQMHKALMLSETAAVKCSPELAIASEDVKCTHGSSIGMLDENQLFYLQSRAIPIGQARLILTKAFLAEVLSSITEEPVYKEYKQKVEIWLAQNMK